MSNQILFYYDKWLMMNTINYYNHHCLNISPRLGELPVHLCIKFAKKSIVKQRSYKSSYVAPVYRLQAVVSDL